MADFETIADKGAQYVLGELGPEERDEFEALIDQSAELRAHVLELEEGALALAIASTPAAPPKKVWREIDRIITQDHRRKRVRIIVEAVFRNGWAAAAACVVGWLFYALYTGRAPTMRSLASSPAFENGATSTTNALTVGVSNLVTTQSTTSMPPRIDVATRETKLLKDQISGLQQQIAQLSSALNQHQAALSDPARLKFLQLSPMSGADKQILSPDLQRAFFYALAHELGWLSQSNTPGSFNLPNGASEFSATNQINMDFVDFRTNANPNPVRLRVPASKELAQSSDTSSPASDENSPSTVIPAFATGASLLVAVDPSMAPAGSELTISAGPGSEDVLAKATMGEFPLVLATRWYSADTVGGGGFYFNNSQSQITIRIMSADSNTVFSTIFQPFQVP